MGELLCNICSIFCKTFKHKLMCFLTCFIFSCICAQTQAVKVKRCQKTTLTKYQYLKNQSMWINKVIVPTFTSDNKCLIMMMATQLQLHQFSKTNLLPSLPQASPGALTPTENTSWYPRPELGATPRSTADRNTLTWPPSRTPMTCLGWPPWARLWEGCVGLDWGRPGRPGRGLWEATGPA